MRARAKRAAAAAGRVGIEWIGTRPFCWGTDWVLYGVRSMRAWYQSVSAPIRTPPSRTHPNGLASALQSAQRGAAPHRESGRRRARPAASIDWPDAGPRRGTARVHHARRARRPPRHRRRDPRPRDRPRDARPPAGAAGPGRRARAGARGPPDRPQQRRRPRRPVLHAGFAQGPPLPRGQGRARGVLRRAGDRGPAGRQARRGPDGGRAAALRGARGEGPRERRRGPRDGRSGADPGARAARARDPRAVVAGDRHRRLPGGRQRLRRRHPGRRRDDRDGAGRDRPRGAPRRRPRRDVPRRRPGRPRRSPAPASGRTAWRR